MPEVIVNGFFRFESSVREMRSSLVHFEDDGDLHWTPLLHDTDNFTKCSSKSLKRHQERLFKEAGFQIWRPILFYFRGYILLL